MDFGITMLSAKEWNDESITKIKKSNFKKIEIVPTKISEWDVLNDELIKHFKLKINNNGIKATSMQAFFFKKDNLYLFSKNPESFFHHLEIVLKYSKILGVNYLVFGAPKNRIIDSADKNIITTRLKEVAGLCESYGITFAVEPVPQYYGNNVLKDAEEIVQILQKIDSQFLSLHFDSACIALNGDDPVKIFQEHHSFIKGVHLAEKDLHTFSSKNLHSRLLKEFYKKNYSGDVTFEILAKEDNIDYIAETSKYLETIL